MIFVWFANRLTIALEKVPFEAEGRHNLHGRGTFRSQSSCIAISCLMVFLGHSQDAQAQESGKKHDRDSSQQDYGDLPSHNVGQDNAAKDRSCDREDRTKNDTRQATDGTFGVKGELEFRSVSLYYDSRPEVPALNNVSFLVRPGEYVAFVGRSGAGKSSTIHLIERFFDPTSGQVYLDGQDIRRESVQTHRARLALVVSVLATLM